MWSITIKKNKKIIGIVIVLVALVLLAMNFIGPSSKSTFELAGVDLQSEIQPQKLLGDSTIPTIAISPDFSIQTHGKKSVNTYSYSKSDFLDESIINGLIQKYNLTDIKEMYDPLLGQTIIATNND